MKIPGAHLILKSIGYAAAALLALVLCAALALQAPAVKDIIRKKAVGTLNGSINGTLSIGKLGGNLFTGIVLEDVVVETGGAVLARVDRIAADYSLPALLRRRVVIDGLRLEGLRLSLRQDRRGRWNYQALLPAGPGEKKPSRGAPWSIVVNDLRLDKGALCAERAAAGGAKPLVDVERLRLNGALSVRGSRVIVYLSRAGFAGKRPALTLSELSGRVVVDGGNIALQNIVLRTPGTRGELSGTVRNLSSPSLNLKADFPAVAFDDLRAFVPSLKYRGSFSTSLALRGTLRSLSVEHRLSYEGLTAETAGTVNLRLPELSLHTAVTDCDLAAVLAGLSDPRKKTGGLCAQGKVSADADLHLKGRKFDDLCAELTLVLHPSRVGGWEVREGTVIALLRDKRLEIQQADIATSSGIVSVRGSGCIGGLVGRRDPLSFRANIAVDKVDPATFLGPRWAGEMNVRADGTLAKAPGRGLAEGLAFDGVVEVAPSSIAGVAISSAVVRGKKEGRLWTVERCAVRSELADLDAGGTIDTGAGIDVTYDVTVPDVARLQALLPALGRQGAKGSLASKGRVGGSIRSPVVAGSISGKRVAYASLSAETLEVALNLGRGAKLPDGIADVRGKGVRIGKTQIERVDVRAAAAGGVIDLSAAIDRDAQRGLAVSGAVAPLEGRTEIRVDTFTVRAGTTVWRNDLPAAAVVTRQYVSLSTFTLVSAAQSLTLGGTVSRQGRIAALVRINSLDPYVIGALAGTVLPFSGRINAELVAGGDAAAPTLSGLVSLADGKVGESSFDAAAVKIDYAQRRLRAELQVNRGAARLLGGEAVIPVDLSLQAAGDRLGRDGLAVTLESSGLDLSLFASFLPGIEAVRGKADLSLRLSGDPHDPAYSGSLVVRDAAFRVPATGTEYGQIALEAVLSRDTVTLQRLEARSGDGRLSAGGKLLLKAFRPQEIDLTLRARNFPVAYAEIFAGVVDADLRLSGPSGANSLTGSVTVKESTIIPRSRTTPQTAEGEIVVVDGTGQAGGERRKAVAGYFDLLAINVTVHVPQNTWVRGQGINAELSGDLQLIRKRENPVGIAGTITVLRGTYELRGRQLTINAGKVTFTGGTEINPFLNAKASGRISTVTVYVNLAGTLREPQITLTSDPAMDESDILSYLIFGKPPNRLSQSEGNFLQSTTTGILSDIAVRGVKDIIGRELSPDVLNIEPGSQGMIGIGKYITSRLFIKYEWRFGIEEAASTTVEYQISDRFSLHSSVGSELVTGLDLFWNTDY